MRSHRGAVEACPGDRAPAGDSVHWSFITHAACRDARRDRRLSCGSLVEAIYLWDSMSRRKSITSVRSSDGPFVRPSGFPVGHCFTPLARRSLFICGRDGHFADGSRRTDGRRSVAMDRPGILLHYSVPRGRAAIRACDE